MSWTVKHFRRQSKIWEGRVNDAAAHPGARAYARRKMSTWWEMADIAEEQFRMTNPEYIAM